MIGTSMLRIFCLTVRKSLKLNIYVLPLAIYHLSTGVRSGPRSLTKPKSLLPYPEGYYSTLGKVLRKHSKDYRWIYTTTGVYPTFTPLTLYRLILHEYKRTLLRICYEPILKRSIELLSNALVKTGLIPKLMISKLRKKDKEFDINGYIDLAFNFSILPYTGTLIRLPGIGRVAEGISGVTTIKPSQIREEVAELLEVLAKHRPKAILEIGTKRGGFLLLVSKIADPNAVIISVDLPGSYPAWRIPLYKSFVKHSQRIHLLRADSHDISTLRKVKEILGGTPLDFLFIDGDTYEGVRRDFEMYSPLVKEGLIALHGIVPEPTEDRGVARFWNEIKHKYGHLEIVSDWNRGGHGIGVIFVSSGF